MYAYANDTLSKWFSLTLDGATEPIATGQVRIVAGSYGGDAGTPLTATQTWPCVAKPDITVPAASPLTAQTAAADEQPSDAAVAV